MKHPSLTTVVLAALAVAGIVGVSIFLAEFEPRLPVVAGACCIEGPSGALECFIVTAAKCDASSGLYYGDGTTCTPGVCDTFPKPEPKGVRQ